MPDWIQVDFAGNKTIDEISVFSLHDNYTQENTPTETQTFTLYGLLNFDVQYWNGSTWVTIPGGSVTGNNKVWRKFTFGARYFASTQGRFISPDPMNSSGIPLLPQTWNRYSYTINNPLLYTDPKGLIWGYHDHDGIRTFTWYDDEDALKQAGDTPYTQSQYFSNQAGTDAVYLGSNGNARHISQDEFAAGVVEEYLRGPESPLSEKEKGDLQRKFALRLKAEHPEWNFWAALFGGLAEGAEGGAKAAAGSEIDAEALTLSKTVEGHLDDITKLGTKARPYSDSRLVMKEIMEAGKPVPDPGGVPGGLRWDVPGAVNGSKGTWELVIDPKTSTVLHFVFKSAPKQ